MAYTYRPDHREEVRDEVTQGLERVIAAMSEWHEYFDSQHPMAYRLQYIAADLKRHTDTLASVCQVCAKIPDDRGECDCAYVD